SGLDVDPSAGLVVDPELQDLTGLVGTASARSALPPEVAARPPAPLRVLGEQRRKELRIAAIESLGGGAKLVDHRLEYRSSTSRRLLLWPYVESRKPARRERWLTLTDDSAAVTTPSARAVVGSAGARLRRSAATARARGVGRSGCCGLPRALPQERPAVRQ